MHVPFNDHASFRDFYIFVVHYAPDFPDEDDAEEDEKLDLDRAFEFLRHGLEFVRPTLDETRLDQARKVLAKAHTSFAGGDQTAGMRIMHEYESVLFRRRN